MSWIANLGAEVAVGERRMVKRCSKCMAADPDSRVVTFSPSWTFIPTHFCRNTCGYCVFVKRTGPAAELAPLSAALAEIMKAKGAGATELLMMSGEGVETSRGLRRSLASHGYESYLDYLLAVARLALEHELLPHINVGNLRECDLLALKSAVPSMGMMLESTSERLKLGPAHRRAPDKAPLRRLATIEAAGRARMPFTTGVLVGIGETRIERTETLRAIARMQEKYGHIQEVIIQPFTPHSGTAMSRSPAPTMEIMKEAVRMARRLLPPEVSVQVPPNIATSFVEFVRAGARDLGGISPDGDRINPAEPWRSSAYYAEILEEHGYSLAPRLAVYDCFLTPDWLPAELLAAAERVRLRLPGNTDCAHRLSSLTRPGAQ